MGLFLSRSSPARQIFCHSSVSLFDLKSRFFVPTHGSLTSSRAGAVKVGRRADLAACSELARPYLDSFEHDGTLWGARLRAQSHSPFRHRKPRKHVGTPPPRTVIGDLSSADGPGRNCWVSFSDLRSLCRPQNNAVRHYALPHETPQGDQ